MALQIKTEDFDASHEAGYLSSIIKSNSNMKWFFTIGICETYATTGTYKEACDSVKAHFKRSALASYGIIKLQNVKPILTTIKEGIKNG